MTVQVSLWELSVHRKHSLDHHNSLSLQLSTTLWFDTYSCPNAPHNRKLSTCRQYQKWCPYKGEEWFLHLFVLTRWGVVQLVPTKVILQLTKAAAMYVCMACLEYTRPPPLSHLFCWHKIYLQNGLYQLTTCSWSQMMPKGIIKQSQSSYLPQGLANYAQNFLWYSMPTIPGMQLLCS